MPNAIEELLRDDSSVQVTGRATLEDVDEIGGIRLERGQSVVCLLGSANRDPAVYPEPDQLDIPDPTCAAVVRWGYSLLRWRPAGPDRSRDCDWDVVAPPAQLAA